VGCCKRGEAGGREGGGRGGAAGVAAGIEDSESISARWNTSLAISSGLHGWAMSDSLGFFQQLE